MIAYVWRSGQAAAISGFVGLALAVVIRVRLAGDAGPHSPVAGTVFGLAVLALAVVIGLPRPDLGWRAIAWGVAGAVLLCLQPLAHHLSGPLAAPPVSQFPLWASVVTLVATAEELLLRGALWQPLLRWCGPSGTVAVTAVAFAAIHVPVYGWTAAPLDLAVGVVLGAIRLAAGSVSAPALTHVLADLAGWWLQ